MVWAYISVLGWVQLFFVRRSVSYEDLRAIRWQEGPVSSLTIQSEKCDQLDDRRNVYSPKRLLRALDYSILKRYFKSTRGYNGPCITAIIKLELHSYFHFGLLFARVLLMP